MALQNVAGDRWNDIMVETSSSISSLYQAVHYSSGVVSLAYRSHLGSQLRRSLLIRPDDPKVGHPHDGEFFHHN